MRRAVIAASLLLMRIDFDSKNTILLQYVFFAFFVVAMRNLLHNSHGSRIECEREPYILRVCTQSVTVANKTGKVMARIAFMSPPCTLQSAVICVGCRFFAGLLRARFTKINKRSIALMHRPMQLDRMWNEQLSISLSLSPFLSRMPAVRVEAHVGS